MTTPDRFGRYRVVRRIGSGAFATVWLAEDEVLDAPVAVKVLADNWSHRLDVRTRFEEEARILRRADSDRVVRVHDIGELPDGRPYFVMTYANRGTLAERLADGPLPVGAALRYGADMARGLAVLHQVGVIHRDVNPGNVLLRSGPDGTERVLIADLGLAKAAVQGSGFTLTVGTPGYMAPEQRRPGAVPLDRRADVYAVGAVVHHLLTGVPPPADEPPPPVRSLRPDVPATVEAAVTQALAPRPEDRFPSAGALADALDAVALRGSTDAASERPPPPPASGPAPSSARVSASGPASASAPAPASGPAPGSGRASASGPASASEDDTVVLGRPARRRGRLVAVLAVLLVLAAAGTATVLVRARLDVTVTTADGAIRLRVPPGWATQIRRTDWDLGPYGVTGRNGVALVVAPDVARWQDPRSDVPGVFAGRADGVQPRDLLARSVAASCPPSPPRSLRGSGLDGTLTRRLCPGSAMAYVEAVLQPPGAAFTVYVQIKQPAAADTADSVVRSLVVNWS